MNTVRMKSRTAGRGTGHAAALPPPHAAHGEQSARASVAYHEPSSGVSRASTDRARGLDNSFFQKHLSENRDTGDNTPSSDADDLDTLQRTTELYKQ